MSVTLNVHATVVWADTADACGLQPFALNVHATLDCMMTGHYEDADHLHLHRSHCRPTQGLVSLKWGVRRPRDRRLTRPRPPTLATKTGPAEHSSIVGLDANCARAAVRSTKAESAANSLRHFRAVTPLSAGIAAADSHPGFAGTTAARAWPPSTLGDSSAGMFYECSIAVLCPASAVKLLCASIHSLLCPYWLS